MSHILKTPHLSNERAAALVVVLPALLAAPGGRPAQVHGLRVTSQLRGVPVQVELRAGAGLRRPGAVVQRKRQAAGVLQAPAAGLPPLRHRRVPAPVIRSETLEDDARVDPRPGRGHQAHQGKDSLLKAAELAGFLQDVIKAGHGCASAPSGPSREEPLIYRNLEVLSGGGGGAKVGPRLKH